MVSIFNIVDMLTAYFNQRNIPFVIGGGVAIKELCNMHYIENDIIINNLDIFYLANTPITPEYIGSFRRVQNCPHTSVSYMTGDGFQINMTMCRTNNIRFISYKNMKLMHPIKLMSYYNDEFSFDDINIQKINVLESLIKEVRGYPIFYINKKEENEEDRQRYPLSKMFNTEPLARRLFSA